MLAEQRWFERLFDVALLGVLFVAPLFMGGRGPIGKFVFVGFVCIMALAWLAKLVSTAKPRIRLSGAEWILGCGVLLLIIQLMPLPESALVALSPHLKEMLPVWFSSAEANHMQIGTWNTISLAPDATRQALAVFVAYALLFLLVVQRVRTFADGEQLLRWIGIATVGLAILGVSQFLFGNGKFLWFYEHPFRTTNDVVRGPFQNQNHFAHMMALGIGPLLWMLMSTVRGSKRTSSKRHQPVSRGSFLSNSKLIWVGCAIGFVALATMLTFSRGGVLAFGVAMSAVLLVFRIQNLWDRKLYPIAGGIGLIVVVALLVHGYETLSHRLSTLRDSRSLADLSHGREALWGAMMDATSHFWITGTGASTHADVYPVFMERHYNVEFTHGESGYLPLMMETGVIGLALLLAAAATTLRWLRYGWSRGESVKGSSRAAELSGALLGAVVASLFHSVGDFVWYISACMSWTIVMLAIAARMPSLHANAGRSRSKEKSSVVQSPQANSWNLLRWMIQPHSIAIRHRLTLGLTVVALLVFSISTLWPAANAAPAWNEYRRVVRSKMDDRAHQTALEIGLLQKTLAAHPAHRKARILLAHSFFGQTRFETNEADQKRIRSYAWSTILTNPLNANAYALVGATLIDSPGQHHEREIAVMLAQALRVGRHNAVVRMICGEYRLRNGELEEGFQHWQFAFNHDPEMESLLTKNLQPIFPAEFLIDKLRPKTTGLWKLYEGYRAGGDDTNANLVATELVERLQQEAKEAKDPSHLSKISCDLYSLHARLGNASQSILHLSKAIELDPNNYRYHHELALAYMRSGDYVACDQERRWCQRRNPDDRSLDQIAKDCARLRLAARSDSATSQ